MAVTPGTSSGTFGFAPSDASVVFEAFDRIGIRPPQVDRHMMFSARDSMNYLFVEWENDGVQLWKVVSGTVDLVTGQASYDMPANLVTVTEVWYSQPEGLGDDSPSDRIMTPMTRTQYAMLPNKLQQGSPTQYWYQMLATPVLTVWQVPASGAAAPTYVVKWYGLQQMEASLVGSGQTPNVVRRALGALTAGMAFKLAEKFAPQRMPEKKALYDQAWANMATRDQELGPSLIQPQAGVYGRIY